jgi:hypothetical protein
MPSETTPPPFETIALFCEVHSTTWAVFHCAYSAESIEAAIDETNAPAHVADAPPPSPAVDEAPETVDADEDPAIDPVALEVEPPPVALARDDDEAVDGGPPAPSGDGAFEAQPAAATEKASARTLERPSRCMNASR